MPREDRNGESLGDCHENCLHHTGISKRPPFEPLMYFFGSIAQPSWRLARWMWVIMSMLYFLFATHGPVFDDDGTGALVQADLPRPKFCSHDTDGWAGARRSLTRLQPVRDGGINFKEVGRERRVGRLVSAEGDYDAVLLRRTMVLPHAPIPVAGRSCRRAHRSCRSSTCVSVCPRRLPA